MVGIVLIRVDEYNSIDGLMNDETRKCLSLSISIQQTRQKEAHLRDLREGVLLLLLRRELDGLD